MGGVTTLRGAAVGAGRPEVRAAWGDAPSAGAALLWRLGRALLPADRAECCAPAQRLPARLRRDAPGARARLLRAQAGPRQLPRAGAFLTALGLYYFYKLAL